MRKPGQTTASTLSADELERRASRAGLAKNAAAARGADPGEVAEHEYREQLYLGELDRRPS